MTTTQKILIVVAAASIAVTTGTAIYQARRASRLQDAISSLQQQQARVAEQIQQLQRERDVASNRLALLTDENAALKNDSAELAKLRGELSHLKTANGEPSAPENDPTQSAAKSWLDRVTRLKQRLEQTLNAKIPELQLLTEKDWLNAAKGELKTEADYRRALSAIRAAGEGKFASMLKKAVNGYEQSNNGGFPTELSQLQPYFDLPVDESILDRWEIVPASTVKSFILGGASVLITQKAPVDDVFDTLFVVGSQGSGSTDFLHGETRETMQPVRDAYKTAHNGQWPSDTSQLEPYVATPEQRAAFDKLMLNESSVK